jgi:hypothetical protein
MACVYFLHLVSSPEDIRYVGMTKYDSAATRFKAHKRAAVKPRSSSLPVYDWMNKYGDQVTFTSVADSLTVEQAQDLERELITKLRKETSRLLNCNDGGDGAFNPTVETRQKISNARKGRPPHPNASSPQAREKISKALKGRVFTPEWREKLSLAKRGKTLSENHKKNLSIAHTGRKHTDEARKKMSQARRSRRQFSPEEKAAISKKISDSRKGKPSWNKGKSFSPEVRRRMSDAAKRRRRSS